MPFRAKPNKKQLETSLDELLKSLSNYAAETSNCQICGNEFNDHTETCPMHQADEIAFELGWEYKTNQGDNDGSTV